MNKSLTAVLFAAGVTILSVQGQGFLNLDFESAQISFVSTNGTYRYIASTNALPGWTAFNGTNQLSTVPYNPDNSGIWHVALLGSNSMVLDGHFSVSLTTGASLSQSGLIPTGIESLLFDAYTNPLSGRLSVFLNGQSLSYMAISNAINSYGQSYTVYGADISAFANHAENLVFLNQTGLGVWTIDDIQFSSTPVPEPGGLVWLALGSGVLVYVIRRRRR